MDPVAILAIASEIVGLLPSAISAGVQVEGIVARLVALMKSPTAATQADLDATLGDLNSLKAQLDADPQPAPV